MDVRALLFGVVVVAMVAAACSGDDDDAATPTVAPATTMAPVTTVAPPVTEAATTTTTTLPTHQIGETVEIWEGGTLTITSIEGDPDPACEWSPGPLYGNEERFVLVRGTFASDGSDGMAFDTLLARLGPPSSSMLDDPDGESYSASAVVVERSENTAELSWCYFIPADERSWTFVAPMLIFYERGYPPSAWDVSF